MADLRPLKLVDAGSGIGELREFADGDTLSVTAGGSTLDFITGLAFIWNSASSITITAGAAYVPGFGFNLVLAAAVTKSGLSLAASTIYHLYLYLGSSGADIEISATAPSDKYFGGARVKTGDTTRRYVGSFITTAAAGVAQQDMQGQFISYYAPLRILALGTANSGTAVSAAAAVPISSKVAFLRLQNTATDYNSRMTNQKQSGAIGSTGSAAPNILGVSAGLTSYAYFPLDDAQGVVYWMVNTPAAGGMYIDVQGYILER